MVCPAPLKSLCGTGHATPAARLDWAHKHGHHMGHHNINTELASAALFQPRHHARITQHVNMRQYHCDRDSLADRDAAGRVCDGGLPIASGSPTGGVGASDTGSHVATEARWPGIVFVFDMGLGLG